MYCEINGDADFVVQIAEDICIHKVRCRLHQGFNTASCRKLIPQACDKKRKLACPLCIFSTHDGEMTGGSGLEKQDMQ